MTEADIIFVLSCLREKYTVAQVAQMLGVAPKTVYRAQTGLPLSYRTKEKIECFFLALRIDDIKPEA